MRKILCRKMLLVCAAAALLSSAVVGVGPLPGAVGVVPAAHAQGALTYPPARVSDQVDDYNGTLVADPYRWLEDTNSDESQAWIGAEAQLATSYLAAIPGRSALELHYNALLNYPRYTIPFKRSGHYFYFWNDGTHRQSPLYTADSLTATPRLLLDPDTFSGDGSVAIASTSTTLDGALVAYGLSTAGSDYREYHILDVASGRSWPDVIREIRNGGVSWAPDDRGFYYFRWPVSGHQQLYYHQLGTDQSADMLIYDPPAHRDWIYGATVTDDGRYLLLMASPGADAGDAVYYRDLQAPNSNFRPLVGDGTSQYVFLGNDGTKFWFVTDDASPNYAVISFDLATPSQRITVVPEQADAIDGASMAGDNFIVAYLHDARDVVSIYGKDGSYLRSLALPGVGSIAGFGGPRAETERFFQLTTFVSPGAIYSYDSLSGAMALFRDLQTKVNPDDFVTEQVFYTSKDGTRVPMFVVHKHGLTLDGTNPTLLYGYGGFGIVEQPFYDATVVAWLQMGGVFALPNIRGGGEYGEAWHEGGMLLNKQNSFDDFIAAAQYLIDTGYTSPAKLAIWGASNGGLLVAACLTQRPDLFAAAVPDSGLMDMLRYPLFGLGAVWRSEYGDPNDPTQFQALYAYSPLHNVRPGTVYPATLIMVRENDDRVAPMHSYKFAAALQAAQAGPAPILLRVVRQSGHGAGTPPLQQFLANVDRLAFLVQALGVTVPDDW